MKLYTHPTYDKNHVDWETYRDLYVGDQKTMRKAKYLTKHEFEKSSDLGAQRVRQAREGRTYYVNLMKPFIKRFVTFVFCKGLSTGNLKEVFGEDAWGNVDGKGTSFEAFLRRYVAEDYFLYGKTITQIDAPSETPLNQLEAERIGFRPYMMRWSPLDVKDWQMERDGSYSHVRTEYEMIARRASLVDEPTTKTLSDIYQIGSGGVELMRYAKEDDDWKLISEAVLSVSDMPFVIAEVDSWAKDGSAIALQRHNIMSCLDNILGYAAHQQKIATGVDSDKGPQVFAEYSIVTMPEGATITVIEPVNPVGQFQRLEDVTNDYFKVMMLKTRHMPSDSRGSESADNQDAQKEDFRNAMVSAAEDVELIANDIVAKWIEWSGTSVTPDPVMIEKEYTGEDIQVFFQAAALWRQDISRSPILRDKMMRKAIEIMNLNLTDDELSQGIEETRTPAIGIASATGRAAEIINGNA